MGLGNIVSGVIAAGTIGFGVYSAIHFSEHTENYHALVTSGVCILAGAALVDRTFAAYNKNQREALRKRGKGDYTSRFMRSTDSPF